MSSSSNQPLARRSDLVAIVGRPNVGKSALFNRLAGERIAIVHSLPGVTRDRLVREVLWEDRSFQLADTGGLSSVDGEVLRDRVDAGIRDQAEAALQDASVAVLVVDLTAGLSPLDLEVARRLRRLGLPVVVAANKADEPQHEKALPEFEQLGFPVFAVSALHNRGMGDLMDAVLPHLKGAEEVEGDEPGVAPPRPLHVAVVGRPNAGKSSFINRLLQSPRVLVSEVPGTTRDSIDVPFSVGSGPSARHYVLIDTAGARRESKIDTAVERYSRFRTEDSIRRADVVILMLDVTRGVGLLDKQLAGEIAEQGKGCLILVNKWDLSEETQRAYAPSLARELPFMAHCPVGYISAETGYNIRQSVALMDYVAAQTQATLPTGILNRVIMRACEAVAPPSKRGRPLRIYYAAQVGRNPITVRLFVNQPLRMAPNYRDYLINQLRRHFGLEGAPVRIQTRMRERPTRSRSVPPAGGATDARRPAPASARRPARRAGRPASRQSTGRKRRGPG